MDAIEIEALLLRRDGANRLLKEPRVEGYEVLLQIVAPSPRMLRMTLDRARETGPRREALRLCGQGEGRPYRKRRTRPKAQVVTLDELLAAHARRRGTASHVAG